MKEVIAVITQVDGQIDDMKVFTDNDTAEKYFSDAIVDYANVWGESQESLGLSDDIYSISEYEVNVALEDGYWIKGDTEFSIVHSSNNLDD